MIKLLEKIVKALEPYALQLLVAILDGIEKGLEEAKKQGKKLK